MRIAIPVSQGSLARHFGHCESFELIEIDPHQKQILGRETLTPPAHEPGVLPAWLADKGANIVLAGGLGSRAVQAFAARNVSVIVGVPDLDPESLVRAYLAGEIGSGTNACDH